METQTESIVAVCPRGFLAPGSSLGSPGLTWAYLGLLGPTAFLGLNLEPHGLRASDTLCHSFLPGSIEPASFAQGCWLLTERWGLAGLSPMGPCPALWVLDDQ